MIKVTPTYRVCAVYGLGVSGLATVRALLAGGVRVLAWDDIESRRNEAAMLGAEVTALTPMPADVGALVLSPGVPLTHPEPHPVVKSAQQVGVPVIGDMQLFQLARQRFEHAAPVIAITGTNGKSTTTALTAHLLETCGYNVQTGGNIGAAVLDLAPPDSNTVYVLELSSYQIDLAGDFQPDVAVLLNLTPDHIDRHGSMGGYVAAKWRLFNGLEKTSTAVIGIDGEYERDCAQLCEQTLPPVLIKISGRGNPAAQVRLQDGVLLDAQGAIATLSDIATLQGEHNGQNAAAAFVAALAIGAPRQRLADGFAGFPGLPHRLQPVGQIGDVTFINDSKATNAEASGNALAAYQDIYWIAGGLAKEGGIETLSAHFDRIKRAYLIGTAAPEFAETLAGVPHVMSGTLDKAVPQATADAMQNGGGIVLFSPACASFDQFRNFEQRGDAFSDLVSHIVAQGDAA